MDILISQLKLLKATLDAALRMANVGGILVVCGTKTLCSKFRVRMLLSGAQED